MRIERCVNAYSERAKMTFSYTPYRYAAKVVSVYDADTITADVDLGFHTRTRMKLRLARINAWEVRGPEREKGLVARDFLREWLPSGKEGFLKTIRDRTGKYGRYLAEIYADNGETIENVNDVLVVEGHAKYQEY